MASALPPLHNSRNAAGSESIAGYLPTIFAANGGLERWHRVDSIAVDLTISGTLFDIKGFPGALQTRVKIEAESLLTEMEPYPSAGTRGIFTPNLVWIETSDGHVLDHVREPRSTFSGHVRATPWNELQRLYFLGYATWNCLSLPFLLARPGFDIRELAPHTENGETWRVLEVHFPGDVPTHCAVQLLYFDQAARLRRVDHETDIAEGVVSQYHYDHQIVDGLVFARHRRVFWRTPEGPQLSSPPTALIDLVSIRIEDR